MAEQLVEAVARAIAELRIEKGGYTYAVGDYLAPEVARAALAAIEAEGYRVVNAQTKGKELSPDQIQQIQKLANGKSIVMNCTLGLGIELIEQENGRVTIAVERTPVKNGYDGKRLRSFMEDTAVEWLKAVAPERLARPS